MNVCVSGEFRGKMSVRQFDLDHVPPRSAGAAASYLRRKTTVAAVINNLVLSAALRLFQASQLAARLSPLLSPVHHKGQM